MRVYGTCYQIVVDTTPTRLCVSTDVPNCTDTPFIALMPKKDNNPYIVMNVRTLLLHGLVTVTHNVVALRTEYCTHS